MRKFILCYKFVFSLAAKAANANEELILINLNNNVYIVRTNAKGQPPEGRGREKQGQKSGFPSPLTVFPLHSLSLTSHPFRFLYPYILFHVGETCGFIICFIYFYLPNTPFEAHCVRTSLTNLRLFVQTGLFAQNIKTKQPLKTKRSATVGSLERRGLLLKVFRIDEKIQDLKQREIE